LSRQLHVESLAIAKELGYKQGIAGSLNSLARMSRRDGAYSLARSFSEESLTIYRELGDKPGIADALYGLGISAVELIDYSLARQSFEEGLTLARELGHKTSIANILNMLGEIARSEGDYAGAYTLYEESLSLSRELGSTGNIAIALHNLGYVAHRQEDFTNAGSFFLESLVISLEDENKNNPRIAENLMGLGGIAAVGNPMRAARLIGAARRGFEAINYSLWSSDLAEYDRYQAMAHVQLDDAAWEAAWAEGQAMTMEQAIKLALELRVTPQPEAAGEELPDESYPNELTRREVELLRLLATGLSNKEMTRQLSLSIHTVESHLHSIFAKIEVTSRGAATRFAMEHGIVQVP
jgi:DNA-binding CsgD family transcriptional regulator/tetratricopeptide (TPR) repeat protein